MRVKWTPEAKGQWRDTADTRREPKTQAEQVNDQPAE